MFGQIYNIWRYNAKQHHHCPDLFKYLLLTFAHSIVYLYIVNIVEHIHFTMPSPSDLFLGFIVLSFLEHRSVDITHTPCFISALWILRAWCLIFFYCLVLFHIWMHGCFPHSLCAIPSWRTVCMVTDSFSSRLRANFSVDVSAASGGRVTLVLVWDSVCLFVLNSLSYIRNHQSPPKALGLCQQWVTFLPLQILPSICSVLDLAW